MSDDETRPPQGDRPGSRDVPWRMVIWAAIALYAIVFLLVNDEKQSVSFVFFTVNTRLVWLILLSMGLGAALAIIGPRWWRSRRR
ncbi:MAG TPA: LapA family protein [Gaiella sp.]|uniref:LapA family protein n=1 Tax=Gaiella sp. TaxID=2663207 RepID=UPI002D803B49|nr:LapA family protein [Gaiella sp.]HET9288460.1 LapA family protein [Gaiella sp.]